MKVKKTRYVYGKLYTLDCSDEMPDSWEKEGNGEYKQCVLRLQFYSSCLQMKMICVCYKSYFTGVAIEVVEVTSLELQEDAFSTGNVWKWGAPAEQYSVIFDSSDQCINREVCESPHPPSPPPHPFWQQSLFRVREVFHRVWLLVLFLYQEGEGDEEEDSDPDYQPPPVSQVIH